MLDGIILFSAQKVYRNLVFVLEYRLKMDVQELIHIGHIEILKRLPGFIPGTRTVKTYLIMCLTSKFSKMIRDILADKRKSEVNSLQVDKLPETIQNYVFRSNQNVENEVINKIMLEQALTHLREVEKKAIQLELMGYHKREVAVLLGYHSHSNIVNKAHTKLKKYMEA
jgi:RNA polymerase sigma factor (sigma-70 family)